MKTEAMFVLLSGLAVACGSASSSDPAPSGPTDVAPTDPGPVNPGPPPVDHGAPSTTYPAFPPAMGQLVNNGGVVLENPVIVTITFPGEAAAADFENLGDKVGAGPYWTSVTSEYGAGAAVSGTANHIRLTDALPASITDKELEAFVQQSLTKATGAWPVPASGNPVYVMYVPQTTDVMLSGRSACKQGVGGYHDSALVNFKQVAYAVVLQCGGFGGGLDTVTVAASHELAEATVDPYPLSRPAWVGFEDANLAWDVFQNFQSENGDACEFYRDSSLGATATDVGFAVQRQWLNASGRAGHDPCVPAPLGKYFSVTPLELEDLDVDFSAVGRGAAKTKGYKVAVGATKTIPLGFYSDGPVPSWTIDAIAGGLTGHGGRPNVEFELDTTTGQNGQKAYLKVTVNAAGKTNTELITVVSTHGSVTHYMPILLGQ